MSIFLDIAWQHSLADNALEVAIIEAFNNNDDAAFDKAWVARERNDQAYFFFLFSRLEERINASFADLVSNKIDGPWESHRSWLAWENRGFANVTLMDKVSLLLERGKKDYNDVKSFYTSRNKIGHGGASSDNVFIPTVAQRMDEIVNSFFL